MPCFELIDPPPALPLAALRPEIEASWRYCTAIGLRPDHFAPPRDGDIDGDGAVLRAGHTVAEQLGRDLRGTGVAVVLVDERTRIVDRQPVDEITRRRLDAFSIAPGFAWRVDTAGTNALGMATAYRTAVTVHGREHFMDDLSPLTTVAAPVSDPRTGQLIGALALVCAADRADVLLLAMARHGAHDIAERLADGGTFHTPAEPLAREARPSFGWDSLTPREHGLVRLIADGLTNREAAAQLYVSRHTIDSHLRHIFRKLGINSRVQLARITASRSAPLRAESA